MAIVKFFVGTQQVDSKSVTMIDRRNWDRYGIPGMEFPATLKNKYGMVAVHFGADNFRAIARVIDYKVHGSKHVCDGRCLNAKGGNCECACGGKNHGAGAWILPGLEVAA